MENQYEDLADGLEYIYIQCIYIKWVSSRTCA